MQVQRFLSKHGLASHAELLDRQGLCDDLPWLIASEPDPDPDLVRRIWLRSDPDPGPNPNPTPTLTLP